MGQHLFTSESVTEGHPDKIADQISDGVLDAVLTDDPMGRVACETLITTGQVMVAGEISTSTYVDIPAIVRATIRRIGYTRAKYGFDAETCGISVALDEQSPDIAQGVNTAFETRAGADGDRYDLQGAGDQGLMFGYASDETPAADAAADHPRAPHLREAGRGAPGRPVLPAPRRQVAGHGALRGRRADGGHLGGALDAARARDRLRRAAATTSSPGSSAPVLESFEMWNDDITFFINPTGIFVVGGPLGDAGLTGPQDHRRHLRRHGPPRRRRVQRQGPVEGRPLGGLRRALGGQERRGRGLRQARRGAGGLRDRRRPARCR